MFTRVIIYLVEKKNLLISKRQDILISLGTIAAIIIVVAIYGAASKPKQTSGNYDAFAQCLTDKGAKFYGAYWCSHCKSQKEMFGTSIEKVNYIECSTADGNSQTKVCEDAKIAGYPTWEFADGSRLEGEVSLEDLAQKTGCNQ